MAPKQGMDPGAARAKRDAMQLQVNALDSIATELSTTYTAAQYPNLYGIAEGDRTVAPWSMGALRDARLLIQNASVAAGTLLHRITTEAQAQETASGNDPFIVGAWNTAVSWYGGFSGVRAWIAKPRTLLELPAAVRMAIGQPGVWRTGLNPSNWGLRGASTGGAALRTFTLNSRTPYWIRDLYVNGNRLKIQNLIDPSFRHTVGRHAVTPGWISRLHVANPGVVSNIRTAAGVAGKGFAVLGIASGVGDVVGGVSGMLDGDVTSGDAWQLADGLVNTVTGIGSLAPPPVGLVFAGAGIAYNAGRWLFGEDGNGQTGLDKIGDFGRATANVVSDVASKVGDVVDDLWPW